MSRRRFLKVAAAPLVLVPAVYSMARLYSPAQPDKSPEFLDPDAVVIPAEDPTNPLNIFRQPITQRLSQLSLELGAGVESDLAFIEQCLVYIDGFSVGVATNSSPDAAVLERKGACGTFTKVLLSLARVRGIPGRSVGFYNYPLNNGHTACELYVHGQWRFFDATTHVYYATAEGGAALPLSYDETRQRYANGSEVFRIGRNSRKGRDRFSGEEIFLKADPQGVIGPENPLTFPLSLDVHSKAELASSEFGPKNQGAAYLGAAHVNNEQEWLLSGLQPQLPYAFEIQPEAIVGAKIRSGFEIHSVLKDAELLQAPSEIIRQNNGVPIPWRLLFRATHPTAVLELRHPYRGPDSAYLKVAGYRLALS